MTDSETQTTKRKKAWTHTKAAVGAYARNPCEATRRGVEAAISEIRNTTAVRHQNPIPIDATQDQE